MNKFTIQDVEQAIEKGSFGLNDGYLVFRGMVYVIPFFNDKEKTVTIARVKNVRGSGYETISYEDLFSKGIKLTTKEARERYPNIVW